MSSSNQQFALKRRFFPRGNAYPRQGKLWPRFIPQFLHLEERCVPAFIPTLTNNANDLGEVLYTLRPANTPIPTIPEKLVTIMNNSNEMVYPILYDANSTIDGTAGKVVRIALTNGGSGYSSQSPPVVEITGGGGIGATATAVVNGLGQVYALNLTAPGSGYTSTPTVKFSSGNAAATATISTLSPSSPVTSLYNPLDPYNQSYRGYVGEYNPATQNVELGLKPGHQVTLQVPLVFWDGGRLFFASNGNQPFQNATDPGNPLQNNSTWNFDPAAKRYIVNADYRDPAGGSNDRNANGRVMWYHAAVANDFGTDGPGQLAEWTIRDPLQVSFAPNMPSSEIAKIFNYDVSYVDNLTLPAGMEITNVPIKLPQGYTGPAIPPANYAALGTDLTIAQMQKGMDQFTRTVPGVDNADLGKYFGGRGYDKFYFPGGPNGINFLKLPAGYNLFALAPDTTKVSAFDSSKFQLVSGGSVARVNTMNTGAIATVDSMQITNVSPDVIKQLVAGMLSIDGQYFAQGTKITHVDTATNTLTLDTGALQTVANGVFSFTFIGSQFTSSTGTVSGSTIQNIDANVGVQLRVGMLVTGPGITAYSKITQISPDYQTVTLDVAPAAGSGAYVFTGGPSSYVVSTLVNNWYSWADYYVAHAAPNTSLSSTGHTRGHTDPTFVPREDPNTLILENLDASVVSQLKIGQVVTGPNITENLNDPSQNTVVSKILGATSVELSIPVLTSQTGTYMFGQIKPIVRSNDAQPYILTFDTLDQQTIALEFSQTVYDVMQGFSLLRESSYLSRAALLLNYVIGGNIGTFVLQGKALPTTRLTDLRDELKSVLRGVANFSKTPEFGTNGEEQWYPDPKVATTGANINGQPATFGVYNLNPYVWFIHIQLAMSGYGFSLDDDTSNAQDAANSIEVAYGGTAATAPGSANQKLANLELYTYGAPFGRLQDQGYIDTTSGFAMGYDLTKYTVISGLSVETVGKLNPFDAKSGQGALVTGYGMKAGNSRVYLISQANAVNGVNMSHVVLDQPTPPNLLSPTHQNGPTGPYVFAGFATTLPVIGSMTPPSGAVGTAVTLTGSGFTKAHGVTFNGLPASSFTVNSDSSITATVPTGATTGRIGVRGLAGTGYSSTDFTVTGTVAPDIDAFSPSSGSLGSLVTLTGTGFTGATEVSFNGTLATSFAVLSDTTIMVIVPLGATGTGAIAVTTPFGSDDSDLVFFEVNDPEISSFSPPSGPVGTVVTITGSAFTGASAVTFNGTAASNYSVLSDTTIVALVPSGATTGPIAVTTSAGTGASATDFTVTPTIAPTFTSFTPPSGPPASVVTLTGTGFTGTTGVTFNGIAASFTVVNDTTIKATVPILATTGPIAVTNSAGTATSATNFTVTTPVAPSVTSFSPVGGTVGTPVTLTGIGFTGATNVSFNGIQASFIVVSDIQINTNVPTGATSGPISVTNALGTGSSLMSFAVNDDHITTQLSNNTIGENLPVGTLVGTISSIPSGTYTYQLAGGGDNDSFLIVGNQLLSAAIFNFQAKSQYQITIRTFQGGTEVATNLVPITVELTAKRLAFVASPRNGKPLRGYDASGKELFQLVPFLGYNGSVSVAVGDVNGDQVPDLIVATAAGPAQVKVFDGTTLATTPVQLISFQAFAGVGGYVAVGDINADDCADIIVGQAGGGGRVKAFDGAAASVGTVIQFANIAVYAAGQVRVALGDFNGDTTLDLITSSANRPAVKVFDGASLAAGIRLGLANIAAFPVGSFVSAGDFNGDNRADIVVGKQSGTSRIKVFNAANTRQVLLSFDAVPNATQGARVAVTDVNGDNTPDIVAALSGGQANVQVFDGTNGNQVLIVTAVTGYAGGLFVAGNGVFGSPLHLQAAPAVGAAAHSLTHDQLAPVVAEAIQVFANAGLSSLLIGRLKDINVQVAALSGSTLGVAYANSVKLDSNAAGYGWSLDGTVGANEVDLLSVLVHEFGHVLGLDHDAGFMDERIGLGELRLPTAHELDMLFSGSHLTTL